MELVLRWTRKAHRDRAPQYPFMDRSALEAPPLAGCRWCRVHIQTRLTLSESIVLCSGSCPDQSSVWRDDFAPRIAKSR